MRSSGPMTKLAKVAEEVAMLASTAPSDPDDSVAIVAESSLDEAMLVGSPQALTKLAGELLRVVAAFEGSEPDVLEGGEVVGDGEKISDSVKICFDEEAPVWPVCVCVTPSRETTVKIRRAMQG